MHLLWPDEVPRDYILEILSMLSKETKDKMAQEITSCQEEANTELLTPNITSDAREVLLKHVNIASLGIMLLQAAEAEIQELNQRPKA
jgi:hypothetical protein